MFMPLFMGYLKKSIEKDKRVSVQRLIKNQQLVKSRFHLPTSSY